MVLDASSTAATTNLVELVPGRLYVASGPVACDGTASWIPASATGWQSSNSYLLRGAVDVVVDTGLACVRAPIMDGLQRILSPGAPISVFLTRAQMDCVGSLGQLVETFTVRDIFTGGLPNPFDQFDATPAADMGVTRSPDDPPIEIFNPALRILSTYWGYDPTTRAAFTADCLSHVLLAEASNRPVLDDPAADTTTQEEVSDHLHAAFWWLQLAASRELIAAQVREFFDTHQVDVVAPSRGAPIKGEAMVRRHVDMLITAITDNPRS
jgi:flavorubredoxin